MRWSAGRQEGFGLVEALIAMGVFTIIATAVAASFGTTLNTYVRARTKTIGEQVATQCVEEVRALAYEDVGLVDGNPPGTLPPTSATIVHGVSFDIARSVSYVNDPLPGGFQTFANYKAVTCEVAAAGKTPNPLVSLKTNIAPPTQPSLNKAVIKVSVVDFALNEPVEDARIDLLNGPSAPRHDQTPPDGTVPFADLEPNPNTGPEAFYDIAVSKDGYIVVPEDESPAPAAHKAVSAGELYATVIRVYKPITLRITLQDGELLPFAQTTQITVNCADNQQTFATNTGELEVSQISGQQIIPGSECTMTAESGAFTGSDTRQALPPNYPDTTVEEITMTMALPTGGP